MSQEQGPEESAVADFLQILEEHRKNCERQGKYVEAEIAKNRLEELKLHEENRRKEAMRSRQIAERLGVEEAHMLEFQQFNMVWDKKMIVEINQWTHRWLLHSKHDRRGHPYTRSHPSQETSCLS